MGVNRRALLHVAGAAMVAAVAPRASMDAAKAAVAGGLAAAPADPSSYAREVAVSDGTSLEDALRSAKSGDRILLEDGTYDGDYRLAVSGTADAPIVIAARNMHGPVLSGGLDLAGEYGWAHALAFSGSGQDARDAPLRIRGDHATVTRCSFLGGRGIVLTSQQYFRIGYNSFSGEPVPERGGGRRGRFDQIFLNVPVGENARLPEHGRIYRNLFIDSDASDTESHTIYIGPSGGRSNMPSLTDFVIEYNYIDTKRRRSVYSKRGGVIRYNYILMTRGTFGIRHGSGAKILGNVVLGCHSAVVNGPDHDIRSNEIQARSGLELMAESRNRGDNKFNAADRAQLIGNRCTVVVGKAPDDDKIDRPVRGVRIYGHIGDIVLAAQEDTLIEKSAALASANPVRLTASEVGPRAQVAAPLK